MFTYTLETERQGKWTFQGTILASDSSAGQHHSHPGEFLAKNTKDANGVKQRCNACRWHEAKLYLTDNDEYILFTKGATRVPGEITYARMVRTDSAFELLEMAVVRTGTPYIPATTARVLARAAETDKILREAYVNRAVV